MHTALDNLRNAVLTQPTTDETRKILDAIEQEQHPDTRKVNYRKTTLTKDYV